MIRLWVSLPQALSFPFFAPGFNTESSSWNRGGEKASSKTLLQQSFDLNCHCAVIKTGFKSKSNWSSLRVHALYASCQGRQKLLEKMVFFLR